jgi:hypothetical protein
LENAGRQRELGSFAATRSRRNFRNYHFPAGTCVASFAATN